MKDLKTLKKHPMIKKSAKKITAEKLEVVDEDYQLVAYDEDGGIWYTFEFVDEWPHKVAEVEVCCGRPTTKEDNTIADFYVQNDYVLKFEDFEAAEDFLYAIRNATTKQEIETLLAKFQYNKKQSSLKRKAKETNEENCNFGVFQYQSETDENINNRYFETKEEAIDFAKKYNNEPNTYTEVWQKPEDGLWGNTGKPIYTKHSSLKRKAFKVTGETNLWKFEAWSGAKETKQHILEAHKGDEFDALIEELYPDGIDETKLNDLLWFESEWLYETLGINPSEENDEESEGNKKL